MCEKWPNLVTLQSLFSEECKKADLHRQQKAIDEQKGTKLCKAALKDKKE
jgi:hypothetical protein